MICGAAWFVCGCATPALLDVANPNRKIRVSFDDTTEEELRQKNRAYTQHPGYFLVKESPQQITRIPFEDTTEEELRQKNLAYSAHGGYFMVEKSPWRKTRDYATLGIGLPFAIAIDGSLIIGGIYLYLWMDSHDDKQKHKK